MLSSWILLFFFYVATATSFEVNYRPTYIAVSAQYSPVVSANSALSILNSNIASITNYVKQSRDKGADIVVFPEGSSGMFSAKTRDNVIPFCEAVPSIESIKSGTINLCLDGDYSSDIQLTQFSCLARDQSVILVTSMCDVQECDSSEDPNCPADGKYLFNTQVVFDEQGNLVTKYHKTHLFGESVFNPSTSTEAVTFHSSKLNTTFGLLICFDLEFSQPARQFFSSSPTVQTVITSSSWFNQIPFTSALQFFQGFSYYYGVNLVVANVGRGNLYSGGGVFSKGEPLATWFPTADGKFMKEGQAALTIAQLPIVSPETDYLVTHQLPAPSSSTFASTSTPSITCKPSNVFAIEAQCIPQTLQSGQSWQATVSHNSVSCELSAVVSNVTDIDSQLQYVLLAYDGPLPLPFEADAINLQICGLVACSSTSASPLTCKPVVNTSIQFERFLIYGTGFSDSTHLFPMVGTDNMQVVSPAYNWNFDYAHFGSILSTQNVNLYSTSASSLPLINAVIYGINS